MIMEDIEKLEREEQQRLAKLQIAEKAARMSFHDWVDEEQNKSDQSTSYPFAIPYEPYRSESGYGYRYKPGTVTLSSPKYQKVFVISNIKKDNQYNLRPNEEFEVLSWNPFIIRSLHSGKTLQQPDPSLFTS